MAERLELDVAVGRFGKLLLDTCVLIDEFKHPTARFKEINLPQRATSTVAVWEFLHGRQGALLSAAERKGRREWLRDQGIDGLPLTPEGSRVFEALLETEGPTSVPDALLAAECLARKIPIVTSNVRDFTGVRELHYVDWRSH
jgi:predicted nucleic acid-binding protein